MLDLQPKKPSMPFELVLHVRNGFGVPTGKTKSFESAEGDKLCEWYEQNAHREYPKRKNKNRNRKRSNKKRNDPK